MVRKYWESGTVLFFFLILAVIGFRRTTKLEGNCHDLFLDGETDQSIMEEVYAYAPLANRIRNGQSINDPYIYDYRNYSSPFISELFPAMVLGVTAKLFTLPLAFIIVKFLFPTFLIIVWTKIGIEIGFTRLNSFLAACVFVFLPKLFPLFPYHDLISYLTIPFFETERVFHPLFSGLFTSLFIYSLIKLLRHANTTQMVITGGFLGILFYTYLFAWTWIFTGLVILAAYLLLTRQQNLFKRLLVVIIIGLTIGIPYFINAINFSQSDLTSNFWEKSVYSVGWYFPQIFRYLVLAGGIFIFNCCKQKKNGLNVFVILIFAGIVLPDLSQVILGINLEADHWLIRFVYPLSSFIFVGFLLQQLRRRRIFKFLVMIVSISIVVKVGAIFNLNWSHPVGSNSNLTRSNLYVWMTKNIPENSVIGTLSLREEMYLAVNTPYYPYVPYSFRTLSPIDESLDRYLYLINLFQVRDEFLDNILRLPTSPLPYPGLPNEDQRIYTYIFGLTFSRDQFPYPIHQQLVQNIKNRRREAIDQKGKLDYLLVTPTDRFYSEFDLANKCDPVFDSQVYQLYPFAGCFK